VKLRRAFISADRGATAVEFAFVAPLVITLLIATIEIGVLEIMSSNLDAAVMVAARKIRTGEADRPATGAAFADLICSYMVDPSTTCHSRLSISVQKAGDFATAASLAGATPAGQYSPGGPGDVVLVEATYNWPLILPMYAGDFRLAGPDHALLDARATFRNEPYG
jgi:Flp pilus assembly protein TadG